MSNNWAKMFILCNWNNNYEILAYWEHPFLKAGQYAPSQPCLWMMNPGRRRPLYFGNFTSRFHFDFHLFWFCIFLINTLASEHNKLNQKMFLYCASPLHKSQTFLHTLVDLLLWRRMHKVYNCINIFYVPYTMDFL